MEQTNGKAPTNFKGPYRIDNQAGKFYDANGAEITQQKFIDMRLDEGFAMIEAMKRRLTPKPNCKICRGERGWVSYGIDPKSGDMYLNVCCGEAGETDFVVLDKKMNAIGMQQAQIAQIFAEMSEAIRKDLDEIYRGTLIGRLHWIYWIALQWWKKNYGKKKPAPPAADEKKTAEEPAPAEPPPLELLQTQAQEKP